MTDLTEGREPSGESSKRMQGTTEGITEPPSEPVEDESQTDDEGLISLSASSLSHFGADFDTAGLVRRLNEGDIIIPRFDPDETQGSTVPGFQRQHVWPRKRMEQFIESLLLGWPVPSIFLVLEPDQRYLVLDGQQRLIALQSFYAGEFPDGRAFELGEVADHLRGATYANLSRESRRQLNNTFIQATVIEPIGDKGRESVYRLFGRLNSGGMALTPQEIRVALYRGTLIDWIRDLNSDQSWRRLFGAPHTRLKDHEMILRSLVMRQVFVTIAGRWEDRRQLVLSYSPPMAEALNSYLREHRKLEGIDSRTLGNAFSRTMKALVEAVGREGIRYNGRLNAAHLDAVIAVVMQAFLNDNPPTAGKLKEGMDFLRRDRAYDDFVSRSTSHRESVIGRLKLASEHLLP